MIVSFPGESSEYRAARAELLRQEIELRRFTERVAAARRRLPPGGMVPTDYVFVGESGPLRMSELFAPGKKSLAIYSFMFPRHPKDDRPGAFDGACPSCTALLDQLDGAMPHVAQRMNMVFVTQAPLPRVLSFAKERGWRHLPLLSAGTTTYNRDYHGVDDSGASQPMLNVFHRKDGQIRHFWASEMLHAAVDPGQDPRHCGTIEPLWNLFDLTPEGRGIDWNEQLDYCCG